MFSLILTKFTTDFDIRTTDKTAVKTSNRALSQHTSISREHEHTSEYAVLPAF